MNNYPGGNQVSFGYWILRFLPAFGMVFGIWNLVLGFGV
jgi:hypothetical protein